MSDIAAKERPVPLRRDLRSVQVEGRRRAYRIVIDEISGSFTRVSEHIWAALQGGQPSESLLDQARAAGWTRERKSRAPRRFSPLYFRIPLGSMDPLATWLAGGCGWLFAPAAALIWATLIAVAAVLAVANSGPLMSSLGTLQGFLTQSNPWLIGLMFCATKVIHELGHAVMCRRMGSRCGDVGVLMMCGVPCPYCDVTDIWRQPSAARRAAVMVAGIYVELIVASLAMLVWLAATDPTIRLHALNLMIVCGVSTVVFNANPLLRYDGYYLLGDLLGSVNLRQEAAAAFAGVLTSRIAGPGYAAAVLCSPRAIGMATFHVASSLYRIVVSIAIATLLLGLAEYFHLRLLAVTIIVLVLATIVSKSVIRSIHVARGVGWWRDVPPWRRWIVVVAIAVTLAAVLLVPMPRYRMAEGWIDASDAVPVFLPGDGMIETVNAEIGERVDSGQDLVRIRRESLEIQHAKLSGQLRVAKLRGTLARRVALDRWTVAEDWKTLQAAEQAVQNQLASVRKRLQESNIAAPVAGIVVPTETSWKWPQDAGPRLSLRNRAGSSTDAHQAWCRISPNGRLHAVLVVDARDRSHVDIGSQVNISLTESPEAVISTTVASVSAIDDDDQSVIQRAAYQVLCPLPDLQQPTSGQAADILQAIGKQCKGVFRLPKRTLAGDAAEWIRNWLGN